MNLDAIQSALRDAGFDGWLFYDHHHRDPIAERILGLDPKAHITRRWYYFVPATGEPRKLVHRIEQGRLDTLPGAKGLYSSWQELHAGLEAMLGRRRTASPCSTRPTTTSCMSPWSMPAPSNSCAASASRSSAPPTSSASLKPCSREEQIASHAVAQQAIDDILAEGWQEIGRRLRPAKGKPGKLTEFDMVQWLSEAMRRENLVWENGPNVSVNANCSDSHYEPTAEHTAAHPRRRLPPHRHLGPRRRCRQHLLRHHLDRRRRPRAHRARATSLRDRPQRPRRRHRRRRAGLRREPPIRGFEADDAARAVIRAAGFADYFTHRTGHNIAHEIHGPGAHLDNLETHDERRILPNTCFSVEPGIYLPEFGVRSEIDMLTAPGKAWVTGKIQRELVRI